MAPPWPAKPRTAVIWILKATDGTSGLKTLAVPPPAQSSSSNAFLGLERPRRASAGPFFVQQWRYSGQPGPGQQLYGFRKRRSLKTLAAPQPAQSSSSNGASVASQAQDSSYMASESDGWHLGLENPRRASAGPVFVQQCFPKATDGTSGPQPAQSSSSNGATVASQAQDRVIWIPKATDDTSGLTSVAPPQPDLSSSSNGDSR